MTNTYSYIDTSGKNAFTTADTPELALKNAPNIASNSGVQLEQNPQNMNTPVVNPTTPTPLGSIDAGSKIQSSMSNFPQTPAAPDYNANFNNAISSLSSENNFPTKDNLEAKYNADYAAAGIDDKTKTVNDLSAKLSAINAEATANKLSTEGQGRGIPMAIIGGQQAQLEKERAIRALPIAAELEAAKGNLDSANTKLTTLFNIQKADIDNKYESAVKKIDYAMQFADRAQAAQLEARKEQLATEKAKTDEFNSQKQDAYKAAIDAGDYKTAAAIITAKNAGEVSSLSSGISNQVGTYKELPDGRAVMIDNKGNILKTISGGTGAAATISNPKYAQALNVILGSGTFTKDQRATITNAINNGQDPFSVIKNQAKNIMGQTLATTLDKYETAKTQMESISSLLDDYYNKGGSTNIFSGNFEKTLNKLGTVNDPELVGIATNIASALQIYRNAVSGTAYSVQEGADIASIFPSINKSAALNRAIDKGRLGAFETTIDSSYRNTLGSAYDDLKPKKEEVKVSPALETDFKNILGQVTSTTTEANPFQKFFSLFH